MSLVSAGVAVLLILSAEAIGVTIVVLTFILFNRYWGGFDLDVTSTSHFNLHPFLMILGFVFLYGNALMVFKVGAGVNISKFKLKLVHFLLQLTAFTLSVFALLAVFKYHRQHGYPNMISLHNWVGLTTVIFFGLQLVLGFLIFLFPRPNERIRAAFKTFHVFFGIFIFGMVMVSVLTGVTEQVFYKGGFEGLNSQVIICNLLSLLLLAFAGLVTYIITNPFFSLADPNEGAEPREESALLQEIKQKD
ncbi:Cytochrome b reductase 1 [Holothuria leucospilota]|uniref:Cytochrome b reductase 1 n=1 Tax=Holothuria leucospilota TaxID=206669 RepID=A0A9Q0YME4_HOLLE|nr:Cytochrome b reductase 1 [Holothuria leucospilota]